MSEQEIYELLGKIASWLLSGAGGAAVLLLALKLWGQKWIENKFSRDLEAFKAQKLHEFDILLTRKVKWHEKEYEVLSESWKKLKNAHTTLQQAISMLRELPDLDWMTDEELKEFLEKNLSEDELSYMKDHQKGQRNRGYVRVLESRDLLKAHKAFIEFHTYFEEHRIFLRPHIKEKFKTADDYVWSAWVSKKMSLQERYSSGNIDKDFMMEAYNKESKEIKPLVEDIENIIQKELFPEEHRESENKK